MPARLRPFCLATVLAGALAGPLLPLPARAETAEAPAEAQATIADLTRALQADKLFDAIAQEGEASGHDLDAALFGGAGGESWAEAVARAYDPAVLRPAFEAALAEALADDPAAVAAATAFYGSPLGQRIVALEIEARLALIGTETREAAEVRAERMGESRDPRLRIYRRIVEAGDMIEMGVAGTLGAYLAFNEGLAETAPPGMALPPEDRSAQVYAEEARIREDTTTWIISFMALAYSPLTDEEAARIAEFAESPEGKALNLALFDAFARTMTPVSAALGRAAGIELAARDV